jgi:serine/threonine protein kinase
MTAIAKKLLGLELEGGWKLIQYRTPPPNATGSSFSHGFIARRSDGQEAFVKVLDIRLRTSHPEPLKDLEIRIQRFNHEADIAEACASERLSRVAHAIGHGYLILDSDGSEQFPYLIFEQAAGDLRDQVRRSKQLPPWMCYRVLHNVATAIRQLHWRNIAHQDVKPSNVLNFPQAGHKLGDFGSAHHRVRARPGEILAVAGDPAHAPPEQLYRYHAEDWVYRRLMADVYHLGSLALYLLTGETATGWLGRKLPMEYHWDVWLCAPEDLLPILRRAIGEMIDQVCPEQTELDINKHNELTQILRYLLEPDPMLRGYPADRAEGVPAGMQRLISRFHVFSEFARLRDRLQRRP